MTRLASLLAISLLASCAARSVGTSSELVEARQAYAEASSSGAAQEAPASLERARVSLGAAEEANRIDPGSQRERDLAFIAKRRARAAIADRNARVAQRDAELAREELRRTTAEAGQALESARADADTARAQAAAAAQQAQAEAEARQAADAERVAAEAAKGEAERERDEALAAMRKLGDVSERDQSLVLTIPGEVMFRSNQAALLPRAKEKLDELAEALQSLGTDQSFVIEGHTDSRGSAAHNRRLSRLRAMAVRSYLIEKGVDRGRIRALGRGEDDPVASNANAEGRANNRRVEIVVTPPSVSRR